GGQGHFETVEPTLAKMNEGLGRQTERADPLRRSQCARIETVTGQRDFFTARAGDHADHLRFGEHAVFEKAAFGGPQPNALVFRAADISRCLAALTLVSLGWYIRALCQGAVLKVATYSENSTGIPARQEIP